MLALLLLLPALIGTTEVQISSARASSYSGDQTANKAIDGHTTTIYHSLKGELDPQWLNIIFATKISKYNQLTVVVFNR